MKLKLLKLFFISIKFINEFKNIYCVYMINFLFIKIFEKFM